LITKLSTKASEISLDEDMVTVFSSISSDSYMKVNSKTIRCKALDVKSNQTDLTTLENGLITTDKEKVIRNSQTELSMKVSGGTTKSMEWAS